MIKLSILNNTGFACAIHKEKKNLNCKNCLAEISYLRLKLKRKYNL